ncbi:MAG: VanZ family protein [Gammaproteobacteria bacterium]|nr:VanZ family protein [Gammaproteobacteria bacterium]
MLPLRHARLWRALSVLILIGVLFATLAPAYWFFDTKPDALSWLKHADKWMHAVTFTVLSVWFCGLFEKRRYWLVAAGLVAFGLFVEFCQLQVSYRSAEWNDILANTAGIIAGLVVAMAGLGGWGLRVEDWYLRRSSH